jgi:hypothetical protein
MRRPLPLSTGKWFDPWDPDPSMMTIGVIAHGLANLCRYSGQTRTFHSVAQHSVHVSRLMERNGNPEWALEGLLHDAQEAFVIDLPAPLKEQMEVYRELEDILETHIWEKFGLDDNARDAVKQADRDSYATEARDLFPPMDDNHEWTFYGEHHADEEPLSSWSPNYAQLLFLHRYEEVRRDFQ